MLKGWLSEQEGLLSLLQISVSESWVKNGAAGVTFGCLPLHPKRGKLARAGAWHVGQRGGVLSAVTSWCEQGHTPIGVVQFHVGDCSGLRSLKSSLQQPTFCQVHR